MSRSYKHRPYWKDGYGSNCLRNAKRYANQKVRRTADIPNGGQYRKLYPQYDIHDYIFYCPKNSYWGTYERWAKFYYRK